jgi:hypothetical protein
MLRLDCIYIEFVLFSSKSLNIVAADLIAYARSVRFATR